MKNKFISALLAGCLVVGCIGPVSAADITTSGGTGETQVKVAVDTPIFSVTVPTALAVNVAADGTVTTSNNVEIVNNCAGPVKVESVTAAKVGDWEMVAWSDTDTLSGEKVGAKKFALSINGTGVAADGTCGAVFESITAKSNLSFNYAAHVAPQKTAITAEDNEQMAKVVFTIGWDEEYTDFVVTAQNRHMVGFKGIDKENLVIPAMFTGEDGVNYKVVAIGDNAFQSCEGITSVEIPNSVTSIGDFAFYGITLLSSITIPSSVTRIGQSAFYACHSLSSVEIQNSSIDPIGYCAFADCGKLTYIKYGDKEYRTDDDTSVFIKVKDAHSEFQRAFS